MDGDLDGFVSRICSELSNSRNPSIKVIVSPLALLLRTEKSRLVFGAHGGVGFLTKLLKLQVPSLPPSLPLSLPTSCS
ncbi:v-type h+-transporting atpase 54 kd subunit [Nannochloropsis gaditana]|uniref:V-type h+-transporting atpase 54 kd subunit n=1 Tax=Nannochloropsis gaditana TaxID=72520 RepID=W7T214_9STRA|nr:v-type h+-transporting atpase 54 kd subunit [Nannochloropsis gaditana]